MLSICTGVSPSYEIPVRLQGQEDLGSLRPLWEKTESLAPCNTCDWGFLSNVMGVWLQRVD
jgi:hypothetical protein